MLATRTAPSSGAHSACRFPPARPTRTIASTPERGPARVRRRVSLRRADGGCCSRTRTDTTMCLSHRIGESGSGIRGPWVRDRSGDGDGRVRGGAGGAPGTIRGGGVSKSATKASRGGIGGEKEYGISTFFRRFSGVEVFVADLDNPRRHGPPGGAPRAGRRPLWACRRPDGPAGRSLGPRDRHLTREHVC